MGWHEFASAPVLITGASGGSSGPGLRRQEGTPAGSTGLQVSEGLRAHRATVLGGCGFIGSGFLGRIGFLGFLGCI